MPTIVIAAGGTAGHVVPALAVADELRASGARVVFAGTPDRAESELVPSAGYEICFLSVTGFDRRNPFRAALAAAKAAAALPASLSLLRRVGADAVLGGGGYVSGPVGLAAVLGRTPLVLTEADSRLGLANRVLARFARRVCLSFPIAGREGERYLVTGRPVSREIASAGEPAAREAARARLAIAPDARCLLVFGGSLGARTLNQAAFEAFTRDSSLDVLHVAGRRDYPELARRLRGLGNPSRYRLFEYLESLADPLAACDLVLARAGGSVFELTAAGRPAVLVPYPHASADHQDANARWMAQAGAAIVVPDADLDAPRLRAEVEQLLADAARLAAMERAARELARPDAAAVISRELLAAVGIEADSARPWEGRRLHFVGIGGAGMSGLALVAARLGAEVSGCDRAESVYMSELREAGIETVLGHDVGHAASGLEMVVSTAIPAELPELAAARDRNAPIHHRGALLADLASMRRTIAVSGTHGKTTTTAMIAHALEICGLEPGYLVGAELRGAGGSGVANARWRDGEWLVVEADESDRSFLELSPEIAVVTNVELDHHTTYGSEYELERAFTAFLERLHAGGTAVVSDGVALRPPGDRKVLTYGLREGLDLEAREIRYSRTRVTFALWAEGRPVCGVELPAPGEHNVLNALAALGACAAAGCGLEQAAGALASFRPVRRRFEPKGERAGALVFDDYAHHPTEVRATLAAARALEPERLIAVFQPHLYSRTLHLHREFGRALASADVVVVLDVYPARERPEGELAGVSGKLVADAAADFAGGRPVWWLPTIEEAEKALADMLGEGDLVVTLGAGDVDRLAEQLARGPAESEPAAALR
jgi:UDP-N-acetylmuramate--alanine ligase